MASGGSEFDSRVSCSICLEPYRGRQPKLLPCHHTFCLQCLEQLSADKARKTTDGSDAQTAEDNQAAGAPALTITCPTCRKVAPVPEGGVVCFQSNFYVDGDGADSMPPTSQDEGAKKLLQKAKVQVQLLEAVVAQFAEDEREMDRQKRVVEQDVNIRYAGLLGLVADARDELLRSTRDAAQTQRRKLQEDSAAAQDMLAALSKLISNSSTVQPSQLAGQLRQALLAEGDEEKFRQQTDRQAPPTFFTVSPRPHEEGSAQLTDCLKSFFGYPDSGSDIMINTIRSESGESRTYQDQHSSQDVDWKSRFDDLASKVDLLTKSVQDKNAALSKDLGAMQKQFATLCAEASALRDKNAVLCQDVGMLQAENVQLHQDLKVVQTQVTSLQSDNTLLQAECSKLCADVGSLQKDLSNAQQVLISVQAGSSVASQTQAVPSAEFKDQVMVMKEKMAAVEKDVQKVEALGKDVQKITGLENTIQEMSDKIANLSSQLESCDQPVAFHAEPSTTIRTRSSRILIFKKTRCNDGNGYNPNTGVFTVPVSGMYIFMVTVCPSVENKPAEIDLTCDGVYDLAYAKSSCDGNSSTCHAVGYFKVGQSVYMRTSPGDCSFEYSSLNCFSGVLVQHMSL